MKQFFQKIKSESSLVNFLILIVAVIISISGIQVFKTEASTSYIGGASNSLYLGGGAVLGVDSPTTGLAVLNGNVSIGTGSPSTKFHVVGTSYFNGRVGIGTSSPTGKLHIRNDSTGDLIQAHSSSGSIVFYLSNSGYIYSGSGASFNSSINVYGDIYTSTYNNTGSCTTVSTTASCSTSGWTLTCPNGRFMNGIENVGGSNSCIKNIQCCYL
jgi:hypothetical protein